jgi:hypothetical protein
MEMRCAVFAKPPKLASSDLTARRRLFEADQVSAQIARFIAEVIVATAAENAMTKAGTGQTGKEGAPPPALKQLADFRSDPRYVGDRNRADVGWN